MNATSPRPAAAASSSGASAASGPDLGGGAAGDVYPVIRLLHRPRTPAHGVAWPVLRLGGLPAGPPAECDDSHRTNESWPHPTGSPAFAVTAGRHGTSVNPSAAAAFRSLSSK